MHGNYGPLRCSDMCDNVVDSLDVLSHLERLGWEEMDRRNWFEPTGTQGLSHGEAFIADVLHCFAFEYTV